MPAARTQIWSETLRVRSHRRHRWIHAEHGLARDSGNDGAAWAGRPHQSRSCPRHVASRPGSFDKLTEEDLLIPIKDPSLQRW